jgi:outer membrane lipoprotein-sorting protein
MLYTLVLAMAALSAAPDVDALFAQIAEKRAGLEVLEADFVEVSELPGDVLSTEGSLLYAKPRRIVYRTEEPSRITLVERDMGYEYEPELKQLVMYDLAEFPQIDAFFLGFHEDLPALREAYVVDTFTVLNEPSGSVGIRLKPKDDEEGDAFFLEASIFLRDTDLLPYRIIIDNEEDTRTVININQDSLRINHQPGPERTVITVAPGTTIVRNNEVMRIVEDMPEVLPDPIRFDAAENTPANEDGPGESAE